MKKIVVANWKMNPPTLKEAQRMLFGLKTGVKNDKAEVVVCPPFVYIPLASECLGVYPHTTTRAKTKGFKKRSKPLFGVGAQNCFWEEKGAFTGEVSPKMLKDLGVKYVILGHSERIMTMAETNEMTAKKTKAVLKLNLLPIVCIGETLEEKNQEKTFQVIEKKFKESLQGITKPHIQKVVIAYEPLWAISPSDKNCSADDALTVALYIRKLAGQIYSKKTGENIRILYGGSVTAANAKDYLANEAINGLLVGEASLNVKEFVGMVKGLV